MKKLFLLFSWVMVTYQGSAQNYVTNGGFETYNYIPFNYTQWDACTGWTNAGGDGTPDYFSTLATTSVHLPNTGAGTYVYPHSGNAIMGFLTWSGSIFPGYREYITTPLNKPLKPGVQYNVSFYLTNGQTPYYGYGSNNIGFYFSDTAPVQPGSNRIQVNPQVEITSVFFDTGWVKFSYTFIASSANKYLTIGNFRSDTATTAQLFYANENRAYYNIDDISVTTGSDTLPVALFSPGDTSICAGNCIGFINLSINATYYKWSFPGGNPVASNDTNPTVCYANNGQYSVQLIAYNGANIDTLTYKNEITVNSLAFTESITSSHDSICIGSGITSKLKADSSAGSLQWQSSPDGIHFSDLMGDTSSVYLTPPPLTQTTSYRLMSSNNCGTDSSNTVTVHFVPAPIANFNASINGKQVTFNSSGSSNDVTSFSWDFGDSTTGTGANPVHDYKRIDTFYVCLTVYNNSNCSYTICKNIDLISTGINEIAAPVSITLYPNPANNSITLSTEGLTGKYDLKIYNVLGQEIIQQPLNMNQSQILSINLNNFVEGTYQMVLVNDNEYYSKQFVHLK